MKDLFIKFFLLTFILFIRTNLNAQLLINEVCINSSEDWVELKFISDKKESLEISSYFVTMYYGSNEKISEEPVTLYSYDRPETPYDDRFALVHMVDEEIKDETDFSGDLNDNKILDVYCKNYYNSFWSTSCIIVIDTDDLSKNNGIVDALAYGITGMSKSLTKDFNNLILFNHWQSYTESTQEILFDVSTLKDKRFSICRKNSNDSNSKDDFVFSAFLTPGKENIIKEKNSQKNFLQLTQNNFTISPHDQLIVPIFLTTECHLLTTIYDSSGLPIKRTKFQYNLCPGYSQITIQQKTIQKLRSGVYYLNIKAISTESKISEQDVIYLIVIGER